MDLLTCPLHQQKSCAYICLNQNCNSKRFFCFQCSKDFHNQNGDHYDQILNFTKLEQLGQQVVKNIKLIKKRIESSHKFCEFLSKFKNDQAHIQLITDNKDNFIEGIHQIVPLLILGSVLAKEQMTFPQIEKIEQMKKINEGPGLNQENSSVHYQSSVNSRFYNQESGDYSDMYQNQFNYFNPRVTNIQGQQQLPNFQNQNN